MAIWRNERIVHFEIHEDERGCLIAINGGKEIPFDIKRIFYIFDVPRYAERAKHSHIECRQILIAVNGSLDINIGYDKYHLKFRDQGLLLEPGEFVKLHNFSEDAVCLVLCSEEYKPEDTVEQYMAIEIPVATITQTVSFSENNTISRLASTWTA